ncbi:MAG: hypothetical protein IJT15_00810 [Rickettsiales bacterium]|nr:hypothetical protein [Rickettsiales bacterium]
MEDNDNNILYVLIDENKCCGQFGETVGEANYGADFFLNQNNQNKVLLFQGERFDDCTNPNLVVDFSGEKISNIIGQQTHDHDGIKTIQLFDLSHADNAQLDKTCTINPFGGIKENPISLDMIKDQNLTGTIRNKHPIQNRINIIQQLLNKYPNVKNIEIHSTACWGSHKQIGDNKVEKNYITELRTMLQNINSDVQITLKLSPMQDNGTNIATDENGKPHILYGLDYRYKQDEFKYLIQPDIHISKDKINITYNKFTKDETRNYNNEDQVNYFCKLAPEQSNYKPMDSDIYDKTLSANDINNDTGCTLCLDSVNNFFNKFCR